MLIKWDNSMEIGVSKIDAQHKKLVDLVNEFYANLKDKEYNENVGKLLQGLIEYTEYHFDFEEKLIRQYVPEQIDQQIKSHRYFTDEIKDLKAKLDSGKNILSLKITKLVKDWLINHIQGLDREYVAPLKEKNGAL